MIRSDYYYDVVHGRLYDGDVVHLRYQVNSVGFFGDHHGTMITITIQKYCIRLLKEN